MILLFGLTVPGETGVVPVRRRIEGVVRGLVPSPESRVANAVELVAEHLAIALARHGREWITVETFARHIVERSSPSRQGMLARLTTVYSADIYLALATAHDVRDAVARFEELHHEVPRPRAELLHYSGRSSLTDWLRIRTMRAHRRRRCVTASRPSTRAPSDPDT